MTRIAELPDRQREVARLVAKGLSNKEIGTALGIAEATIKVYLKTLFTRYALRNRVQLARLVFEQEGL